MKRRFAFALAVGLCPAIFALACGPTPTPPTAPPMPSMAEASPPLADDGLPNFYDRQTLRLTIQPLPMARVVCEVRANKVTRRVEWDPAATPSLSRYARVPKGPVFINCGSDTLTLPTTSTTHLLSYSFDGGTFGGTDTLTFGGQVVDLMASEGDASPARGSLTVKVEGQAAGVPDNPQVILSNLDLGAPRAFEDTAAAALNELLRSLAEIALEKAKSRAAALLSERIQALCTNLAFATDDGADGLKKVPALPRTCSALEHLRIDDLAASGDLLLRAVTGDLVELGFKVVSSKLTDATAQNFLQALKPLVGDVVEGKTDQVERDLRLAFLRVARVNLHTNCTAPEDLADRSATAALNRARAREEAARTLVGRLELEAGVVDAKKPEAKKNAALDEARRQLELARQVADAAHLDEVDAHALLQEAKREAGAGPDGRTPTLIPTDLGKEVVALVLATASECLIAGGCDEADVNALLNESASCVRDDSQVAKLTLDLLAVFSPPRGTPVRDVLKNGFDVFLTLLEQATARNDWESYVQPTRDLVHGLLDQNPAAAITAGAKLLDQYVIDYEQARKEPTTEAWSGDRKKLMALLTGIATYASSYSISGKTDAETSKAQHDARKKALETLIEQETDRSGSGQRWIFSVGANVGFIAGMSVNYTSGGNLVRASDGTPVAALAPQLSLPMGLSIQRLPKSREFSAGFHFGLSLLDLGQYIAYDNGGVNPSVASAFSIGAQLGVLIGTSSDAVFIGPDFRYAPMLRSDTTVATGLPSLRLGLINASYYVPFFDLWTSGVTRTSGK